MTTLLKKLLCHALRHSRAHMLAGAVVLAAALFLLITGRYDSLAERQQTEALLNGLALAALTWVVAFWYLRQFVRPLPAVARCRERLPTG